MKGKCLKEERQNRFLSNSLMKCTITLYFVARKLFLPRDKVVLLEDKIIKIAWRSHELVPANERRPYHDFSLKKWEAPCHFKRTGNELCSQPGKTILFLSASMAIVTSAEKR